MKKIAIIALLTSIFMLQGCIAAVIGAGAGSAAKVASDPRSTGTQVDDATLDTRVNGKLKENRAAFNDARINVSTYNSNILLTGQASSQQSQKAEEIVKNVDGVKKVYNQLRQEYVVGASTITNDAWITTKVKSQLIAYRDTKARNIKVVTENSEVFLMGIVSRQEGKVAAEVTSKVAGVKAVITLFKYE